MTPYRFAHAGIGYRIEFDRYETGWRGVLYRDEARVGEVGSMPDKFRLSEAAIQKSITAAARGLLADPAYRQPKVRPAE